MQHSISTHFSATNHFTPPGETSDPNGSPCCLIAISTRGIWWMLSYPTFRRVTQRILKFNFDHLPRKKQLTDHDFPWRFWCEKTPRTSTQTSSRSRSIISQGFVFWQRKGNLWWKIGFHRNSKVVSSISFLRCLGSWLTDIFFKKTCGVGWVGGWGVKGQLTVCLWGLVLLCYCFTPRPGESGGVNDVSDSERCHWFYWQRCKVENLFIETDRIGKTPFRKGKSSIFREI